MEAAFRTYDCNGNGYVEYEEAKVGFADALWGFWGMRCVISFKDTFHISHKRCPYRGMERSFVLN